ncbi:hypothetical protein AC579_4062 [Pseudocercospora musae]|uniref:Uncharacterized protein n=1 Tax=Pseudocercospora musae TaxID=113226 RepID=A0A139I8Y8_9PEZI|nr:hypothetical protein AC579_4062 [Pseudocercospora musae]
MAGLLSGVAGGLTSGDGPLSATSGLTDGLTGGGLGDTLGGVSGLAGGLLGGGEGLNVAGLVGLGSDDPALLDLNPAEKKPVKAQKAAMAKKNEMKRQAEMKKLQDQVRQQGGKATPEQQAYAKRLQESQAKENEEMAKLDRMLGPTDPELLQQAMASENGAVPGGNAGSSSEGLFYAYLVDGQTAQPTHVMTFANAAAANAWHQSASQTARVDKVSPQMYIYEGSTPPRPGRRMACMPIQTVQPIIPLQHSNGYPICCKDRAASSGGSSSGNNAAALPAKPPRKKYTWQDAAEQHATNAQAAGDPRPRDQIVQEAMQDLKDQCAASHASGGSSGPTSTGATNGVAPAPSGGSSSGPVDSLASNSLGATNALGGAGPLGGDSSGGDGGLLGGLGGGLLGSGEGLNVAGLLAIGSDEKALLDLNPAQKKEEKLKRARELKRQSDLQARQKKELEDAVKRQNGQATPEQRKQYEELTKRQAATGQAANALNESIKKDDEEAKKGLTGGLPGPVGGVADGLPSKGLTDGLPTSGLTEGLPTGAATGAVSGVAGGLPTGGLTKGIGL